MATSTSLNTHTSASTPTGPITPPAPGSGWKPVRVKKSNMTVGFLTHNFQKTVQSTNHYTAGAGVAYIPFYSWKKKLGVYTVITMSVCLSLPVSGLWPHNVF